VYTNLFRLIIRVFGNFWKTCFWHALTYWSLASLYPSIIVCLKKLSRHSSIVHPLYKISSESTKHDSKLTLWFLLPSTKNSVRIIPPKISLIILLSMLSVSLLLNVIFVFFYPVSFHSSSPTFFVSSFFSSFYSSFGIYMSFNSSCNLSSITERNSEQSA